MRAVADAIYTHSMERLVECTCRAVRPGEADIRQYGLAYSAGVCAQTVGSSGICMHRVEIPPGAIAKAHQHPHESTIYVLSGTVEMAFGPQLKERITVTAGDFLYIPAGMPHKPWNSSQTEPAHAIIARTDPNDEEAVKMRPDLDALSN